MSDDTIDQLIERIEALDAKAATSGRDAGKRNVEFFVAACTLLPACARLLAIYGKYEERLSMDWYVGLRDELAAELAKVIQ